MKLIPITIVNYGDAFHIDYVEPTGKSVQQVDIHKSVGGVLLFAHILKAAPLALSGRDLNIVTLPKSNEKPVPMRLSYFLGRKESKPGKPLEPLLMADAAYRAGMIEVRKVNPWTFSAAPDLTSIPKSCDVFFERVTEWSDKAPHPKDIPKSCHHWLRCVSPVQSNCQVVDALDFAPNITVNGGACVMVNAVQMAALMRVRLQSSYEAMVVDLVRWWDWETVEFRTKNFKSLFGRRDTAFWRKNRPIYVICRLPGGGLFLYGGLWPGDKETKAKPQIAKAWLIFDKDRPADIQQIGGGRAKGTGIFVAACIAEKLCSTIGNGRASGVSEADDFRDKLIEGAEKALHVTHAYRNRGVECVLQVATSNESLKKALEAPEDPLKPDITVQKLELDLLKIRSRENLWSMAQQTLKINTKVKEFILKLSQEELAISRPGPSLARQAEPDDASIYEAAGRILLGSKENGNEVSDAIPAVRFGALDLIDREETQDYLAIQNILLNYVESKPKIPLNLGVFGPPGSGKSFGTKQLLEHLGKDSDFFQKSPSEFNLSQFRSLDDLAQALHIVRDQSLRQKMPVAFFDEFDSSFQGRPYGWLQYLLAPMQDGKFWDNNQEYVLGRCVLVFAGGVNRRFEEMNGRLRDPNFCGAKGPDFISRLRGVLNIKGVNRPEEPTDQGRYLLRRAVLLRSMVLRIHKDAGAPPPLQLMDATTARAFLKIDGFRHGNRSMEAILRMSHLQPGRTLRSSDLPPLEQLEMHVDGKHFNDFLKEGRDLTEC